jgi:MFS transporter, DHA1 family, inner membrane transport protein
MKRKELLLLLTLALIQFTNIMDFMIIMPLGNQLMKLFQIEPRQFGYIVGAYTVTAGIVGFAGAFFIDNFDRRKLLLTCYVGFLIGTLACGFAPSYITMLLARILTGIFGGILGTLVLSIVGDAIPGERRATAMGIVTAGFSLAAVFGVPFGNYLAHAFSWHAPFQFIAGIGTLIIIAILIFIPKMDEHIRNKSKRPDPLQVLKNLWENNNQRKALLLMCLLMLSQFTIIPFIAPYMEKNVGFTQMQVTYIYLFGGLCTVFTAPLIGRLADKIGKHKVFRVFAIFAIIPIFLITNMPVLPIWIVLIVTSFFFIAVNGRVVPAIALITGTTLPQTRGSFMSFNSSVQQLSAGLASFISGAIITQSAAGELINYEVIGYIAIIACIGSIWAAGRIKTAEQHALDMQKEAALNTEVTK